MRRRWIASIVLGAVLAVLAAPARAEDKKPDATLKLTEGTMAVGIGWSWGKGELTYMGKTYKFKVEGATIGEVGKTEAKATGKVFNLKKLDDFDGVYAAAGAGATGGTGAERLGARQRQGRSGRPHERDQGRQHQSGRRGSEAQAREVAVERGRRP